MYGSEKVKKSYVPLLKYENQLYTVYKVLDPSAQRVSW